MEMSKQIARPALRYYGGQWANAAWIIDHWPKHTTRVIPFMGGLNEELRAPAAKFCNAADLDARVINFFDELRRDPGRLVAAIKLTPWHEAEYKRSITPAADPFEDARRFFCLCWMHYIGGPTAVNYGFRWVKDGNGRWRAPSSDLIEVEHLYKVADRLKSIHFLQRDGIELILKQRETPGALIWIDPPFLKSTRGKKTQYQHESGIELHRRIAAAAGFAADRWPAYILINGYAFDKNGTENALYKELYPADRGWVRIDKETRVNSGSRAIQSLWINEATRAALEDERGQQLTLFGLEGID